MKDVLISIQAAQSQADSQEENLEFITQGTYCYDHATTTFSYMESEMTGLEGTKTIFQIEGAAIHLIREGAFQSHMVFQLGKKHTFLYETPYGATAMGVSTRHIQHNLDTNGGYLEIDYTIDLDGVMLSDSQFRIGITPQNSKA